LAELERKVWAGLGAEFAVKRKVKPGADRRNSGNRLIAFAVALFVLLLLLRMIAFFAGHGRHDF
jgi:hypothetical protein